MAADSPLVGAGAAQGLEEPVALTGGTGFVGSHVVETLCAAGIRPRVLVRDPASPRWIAGAGADFVEGSLEDGEALRTLVEGARTVLHLAGVVRAASTEAFERGNREGTARLVEAVREVAPMARVVHVSSQAALGPSPGIDGLGPEAEPHPISAYGRSKLGAEEEIRRLGAGGSWLILRPPAIFGPRDIDVLQFFRLASRGIVPIPRGDRWVTMAWVGDVVRAILAAARPGVVTGRVYHLGEPYPYRMTALVQLLAGAGGVRARIIPLPETLLGIVGTAGSGLQHLGFRKVAMTRDKARELTARHWTLRTHDSLEALGISEWVEFPRGAALTWAWYREMGWLR
ncbi:MAG: NAD-dependent epimerase/dehydratase family protein [Acidobacteria bacterium]|nr:NAD-dependent epimerase/dehydratase family protein [Acidobacteriota bacterium]